jgi:hypothetical protein
MRFTALAVFVLAVASTAYAETRVYSTTIKGKTEQRVSIYTETLKDGFLSIVEEGDEGRVSSLLASDWTVVETEIQSKQGSVKMVRSGNYVETKGTWDGKTISGKYELKNIDFYGFGFSYALKALGQKGLKNLKFPVISMEDPSKAVVMEIQREGDGEYKGKKAIKVKLTLTGALAALWSGRFLIGEDGTVYRYEGNQGPGTPNRVTELVEIRK